MISGLGRFVEALRRAGVEVSPAELLDAARALAAVGVEDRARLRAALGATLAKDRRRDGRFAEVFERFFRPPARRRRRRRGTRDAAGGEEAPGRSGRGVSSRPSPRRTPPPSAPEPPNAPPRTAVPSTPSERRRPRPEATRPERVRDALEHASLPGRRAGRLRRVDLEADTAVRRRGSTDRVHPQRRDLRAPMTTDEELEIARQVPRLVARLKLSSGRRCRASSSGRLWLRHIHRRSQQTGGVPFVLPYRRPRPRRPRVVLLVDVSWSVARAAGLFLWMASEFHALDRRTRILPFVDRVVDGTAALTRWGAGRARSATGTRRSPGAGILRRGESFPDVLAGVDGLELGAPSDYGRVFHQLLGRLSGGRDTLLVILGDARTNRFDPLAWAFEELGRRMRAVVWLVPEARARWGSGDSALAEYLPHCDAVVETRDLEGLGRGLAEVLRRL